MQEGKYTKSWYLLFPEISRVRKEGWEEGALYREESGGGRYTEIKMVEVICIRHAHLREECRLR